MKGFKVAICHQGFASGDAIGNDMAGMYRLLEQIGMEPTIVCEWNSYGDNLRVSDSRSLDWKQLCLIIYHHSQYWAFGERLFDEAVCPVVVKYHNITPSHFFQPYSQ